MTSHETLLNLERLLPLLLVPATFAAVGFVLGRLLRVGRPKIEKQRPRLAMSYEYLRDAHNAQLSPHTRVRCAFESVYFCLAEVAESGGVNVSVLTHPSASIADGAMAAISAPAVDRKAVRGLVAWAASMSPAMPGTSPAEACLLAERTRAATISLLTSTDGLSATPTDTS
jgi:hypothetical protein